MKSARPSLRRRAGFTLIELMVAMLAGIMVVGAVYMIGSSSAREFQDQQRVSQLQLSVRLAMDRVRRDVALAGFLMMPEAVSVTNPPNRYGQFCGTLPPEIRSIAINNGDSRGAAALGASLSMNPVQTDSLNLVGNFRTGDAYLIREWNGAQMILQSQWQGFRRSFSADRDGTMIDAALFQRVFAPGTVVHVIAGGGYHFFQTVTGVNVGTTYNGAMPTLSVSPGFPAACRSMPGIEGWCQNGCIVAPVQNVSYFIGDSTAFAPELNPITPAVTGPNTILYRQEQDFAGTVLATRPVLEYAVHFDVDLVANTANVGLPPALRFFDDGAASAQLLNNAAAAGVGSARRLVVSLAGRLNRQDPHFPWPYGAIGAPAARPAAEPLNRFLVFPTRSGASRVRYAEAEVFLPNIAGR